MVIIKLKNIIFFTILLTILLLTGCSINRLIMNKVGDTLTKPGSGTVFTGDNDPELVGDALPFAIKMYESLLGSAPYHRGLQLQTGSLYIMYANAFLDTPSSMMSDDEYKKKEFLMKRAKNLYLRGRDILLNSLEKRYPGFLKKLNKNRFSEAFQSIKKKEAPFFYWAAAGWIGAFSIDPFDMKLGITLPRARELMKKVPELDKNFSRGSIYDFYISYYGSLPDYMGGDVKKARENFKKSIDFHKERTASPYVSLATSVSIKEQNLKEFKQLLKKAISIDVNNDPKNRLVNIINIRKAKWYLGHIDDFFLESNESDQTNENNTENNNE